MSVRLKNESIQMNVFISRRLQFLRQISFDFGKGKATKCRIDVHYILPRLTTTFYFHDDAITYDLLLQVCSNILQTRRACMS